MNVIEKGKKQLIGLSVTIIVVSLAFLAGGVFLIVSGAIGISESAYAVGIVLKMVFGVILILLGIVGLGAGIVMVWTGGAIKAKYGSIMEGNLGFGTVNMQKCPKCGSQIKEDEKFCGICGYHFEKPKCPNCGEEVDQDKKYCTNCGEKM
ncbi:MAG: zinc ribbon domain-containing protein [Clostridia bacterium]|nr:zinc ribbon domain-containing protein [Clostridia bacterium]